MRTNMSRIGAVLTGLAGAGLVLTACAGPVAAPPAAAPPPSSTTVPAAPAPPSAPASTPATGKAAPAGKADKVLGPRGYDRWVLRMSKAEVLAIGGLVEDGTDVACTAYRTKDGARIVVSDVAGLVSVEPPAGAHTPEGIRVGSTIKDVLRVYPNAQEFRAGFTALVPGSDAFYSLRSDADGNPYRPTDTVDEIQIGVSDGNCMLAQY